MSPSGARWQSDPRRAAAPDFRRSRHGIDERSPGIGEPQPATDVGPQGRQGRRRALPPGRRREDLPAIPAGHEPDRPAWILLSGVELARREEGGGSWQRLSQQVVGHGPGGSQLSRAHGRMHPFLTDRIFRKEGRLTADREPHAVTGEGRIDGGGDVVVCGRNPAHRLVTVMLEVIQLATGCGWK